MRSLKWLSVLSETLLRCVIYPLDLNYRHGPPCPRAGQARAPLVWLWQSLSWGRGELPIVLSSPCAPFPGSSFPFSCAKPHNFPGGSPGSKRNFGDGFPDVKTMFMKVQRRWDLSCFDLWEKTLYFKKSEIYNCPLQPKYFTITVLKRYSSRLVLSNPGHFRDRILPSRKI